MKLASDTAVRTIVLMGGPCSGQTHRVTADSAEILVHDAAGHTHTYVGTGLLVDAEAGGRWEVFRRAPD